MRTVEILFLLATAVGSAWHVSAQDALESPPASPGARQTEPPPGTPGSARDIEAWRPQLEEVRGQLDVLGLFAAVTALKPVTIRIPKEIQRLSLPDLEQKGIRVFLKEVSFDNVKLDYEQEPQWVGERPAIASVLDFAKIGVAVDVKTRVGQFPVGCVFRNGKLPCDFDLSDSGYAINVIPERRANDARLDNVAINLGGPLVQGPLSKFFGKELARTVLQFAAGQTLKMDRGALLGEQGVESLLEKLIK